MSMSSGLRARRDGSGGKSGETALSWAAVAAAVGAVFAWAACCVLPMSLALAGLGLGGLSLIAEQRNWITLAALAVIGGGWLLTWRRARRCRVGSACAAPSRLGTRLLSAATALALLALLWQPVVEPWALALIRSARQ
ncbi:MAG: MFS transporter permease [Phenylobacterium sp.]|jgi:mercuric ion transport protein|nr:MFS transporter permease [Phenylobacterium sp.]